MSNYYRGPSIDVFYQVSVHLAKRFQRRRIFFKLTNQKHELPVAAIFLMDRNEMCNHYRGPSIYASYQVSVHLAKLFQGRFFRNQSIRNKNCLWWPCLLMDRDKMCNLYRGPAIDASC